MNFKIYILLFLSLFFVHCKNDKPKKVPIKKEQEISPISSKNINNSIIYQVNIRQYSPEGTFNSFTNDIEKLKKLGVQVIWLMPIQPIGIKNRLANRDIFVEEINDSINNKNILGNPYSIKDYKGIHTDYGTANDLKKLIKTAHKNGIYVVLDWVANHTAYDHSWVNQHPEYYLKNQNGDLKAYDYWKDVAVLDYQNHNMRKNMIAEMKYWLTTFNIDGFRANIAAEIPVDFWEQARKELETVKPLLMIAEAEMPNLLKKAFNIIYGWEFHFLLNEIAKQRKTVVHLTAYLNKVKAGSNLLLFTSNHDENTWNGSAIERLGEANEIMTCLTYLLPGTPLIYNGQEYDLNKKLDLFTKDNFPHTIGKMMSIYEKLGTLKATNTALNANTTIASFEQINTSNPNNVFLFERKSETDAILFIGNLSNTNQSFTMPLEGSYYDYMQKENITIAEHTTLQFKPWEYKILVKKEL